MVPVSARLVKVATPLTVFAVSVPPRVPAPEASVAVSWVPVVGTVLPFTSTRRTTGCGESTTPLWPVVGAVVIASAVAVPGFTVKEALVTPVSPAALAARV